MLYERFASHAHMLTCSHAHMLTSWRPLFSRWAKGVFGLIWIAMLLPLCGCDAGNERVAACSSTTSINFGESKTSPLLDAGVVFSDRKSSFCWPLDRLIPNAVDSVDSVSTSCDCVHATIVSYRGTTGRPLKGLLLAFNNDSATKQGDSEGNRNQKDNDGHRASFIFSVERALETKFTANVLKPTTLMLEIGISTAAVNGVRCPDTA